MSPGLLSVSQGGKIQSKTAWDNKLLTTVLMESEQTALQNVPVDIFHVCEEVFHNTVSIFMVSKSS